MVRFDDDGGLCAYNIDPLEHKRVEATKLLDCDLDESGLALMEGSLTDGFRPETGYYSVKEQDSLPSPREFGMIAFSGLRSYTLYTGINYGGNATCVEVGSWVRDQGYGISQYMPSSKVIVGSFRVGCNETEKVKVQALDRQSSLKQIYLNPEGASTALEQTTDEQSHNLEHDVHKSSSLVKVSS